MFKKPGVATVFFLAAVLLIACTALKTPPASPVCAGLYHNDQAAISPNGKQIAYLQTGDGELAYPKICVMNIDGSNKHLVVTETRSTAIQLFWTADSQKLAFWVVSPGSSYAGVVPADGSTKVGFISEAEFNSLDKAPQNSIVSPDGQHFLLTQGMTDFNTQIYLADAERKNPRLISDGQGSDENPVWSPDGKHIIFDSLRPCDQDIKSCRNIFIMDRDGKNLRQLTGN